MEENKPYVDESEITDTKPDELAMIGMSKEERRAYEKKIEANWLKLANRHNRRGHAAMQRRRAKEFVRRNRRNAKKATVKARKGAAQ
jgi:hypothetical protein